ncbi:hypothetical protein GCM10028790_08050 [Micromonospora taraxaci]|uniref:Uncharacterized protein n=1 Tax=Micromonospora taraxaci TaxID=1316803 RepID=A0A561W7K1_9ACTN|nr:hypothetical protein [Micromonospora taraxaci]TWG19855.1 hypothetical protein FHU34_115248 [Micromonospora taraxaci]
MRYALIVAAVLGVALGIAAVVLGGADDSPGLQLIGVVLVSVRHPQPSTRQLAARLRPTLP